MCMIEVYDVVYPDGTREPRERLVNCPRGTPNQPCRHTERRYTFEEHPAVAENRRAPDIREDTGARYHVITPPESERPRSRREGRAKPKGFLATLFSAFKGGSSNPARTRPKKVFVRNRRKLPLPDDRPATIHYPPRAPTPPQYYPPHMAEPATMPNPTIPPRIIPIEPRQEHRHRERDHRSHEEDREPRQQRRGVKPVKLHYTDDQDDSSSPPKASRRHQRKSRSLSPISRYEAEKRAVRERERRQHEERIAREEREARERAIRLERYERRERERAAAQRHLEFEERRRIESAERARQRRQQEDRDRERARVQARTRQEQEDIERIRAANARARLREEEEERRARFRRANVPLRPRHEPAVRYGESMEDRGERFIRESIERERRRPPMAYDRYGRETLQRRNTVDCVPRRRYGEDRPWHSR